jgi:hypothetical protein
MRVLSVFGVLVRPVGLLVVCFLIGCTTHNSASGTRRMWGEYGGKFQQLRLGYSPPQGPHESNHFIDLISGTSVQQFARAHGLVNNNALFVFSHGKAVMTPAGRRYAFLTGLKGEPPADNAMAFSPLDLARVLGRDRARRIHNLVLAGCNTENMFYPDELLQYFPAVTNIIHAEPGTDAYEATFQHALTHHSREVAGLYRDPEVAGMVRFGRSPRSVGARNLVPYVARLYAPGSRRLLRIQVAGRELLDPAAFSVAVPPQSRTN